MSDPTITCPECSAIIPLTEALAGQIDEQVKVKTKELDRQSKHLDDRAKELETEREKIAEEVQYELQIEKNKIEDAAVEKALAEESKKTKALKDELKASKQKESKYLDDVEALEQAQEDMELNVKRQISEARKAIIADATEKASEENLLKLREKDEQLDSMKSTIETLKRKAELGSQETQGEALEKQLQEILQQTFKFDKFSDVKKGLKGADIIQTVFNSSGKDCGTILWETKNTKTFMGDWVEKLKKDQQAANADIAVLMTVTLPREIKNFGMYKGIWVTTYNSALGLATALRNGLLDVAKQKIVSAGNTSTKTLIYDYVTGKEFAMTIKVVASAFIKMQEELEAERRAITRIWKKREKQLVTVVENLSGMRGSIEGISQKALPDVDVMSLEEIGDDDE